MFAKFMRRKEARTTATRIEKAKSEKSKRTEEMELAYFNNEQINLPCSSYAKFLAVKKVQCPAQGVTWKTASYLGVMHQNIRITRE